MRCVVGGGWAWFREGGGMPSISLAPLSGRYLPFTQWERSRSSGPACIASELRTTTFNIPPTGQRA